MNTLMSQVTTHTTYLNALERIRSHAAIRRTKGLGDDAIVSFLTTDTSLRSAIASAELRFSKLATEEADLIRMDEAELCTLVQKDFLNFYGEEARCPYVPLAASGPWIVTTHGAVLHDSGGYGMLGMGHAPESSMISLAEPLAMANIMTPSLSQKRFAERLKKEIGNTRGSCPFDRFLCMNSGSEAVTVASRICDLGAFRLTRLGMRHYDKPIKTLSLNGSFHGRTELAARVSHSTYQIYESNLASYRGRDDLLTVDPNDTKALLTIFKRAQDEGFFIDSFFIEPVMGEGIPGLAITSEFYDAARELTTAHGSLLVVDSIQAGLRTHGYLSIVDYPGFSDCAPPDMETFSKALNGGQYPLSVLALGEKAAKLYVNGIYGNTMTANPRALEVGCAILDSVTDELRVNIQEQGEYFLSRLEELKAEFPSDVIEVNGTGLMLCAELNPKRYKVQGRGGFEEYLRLEGISMVHGGKNGLRFTPHFAISKEEVDLIIDSVKRGLKVLAQRAYKNNPW